MSVARAWALASLIVVAPWHPAPAMAQSPPTSVSRERVTFKSDGLTLVGFLFKPDGVGPFPALVWNHGSEQNPGTARQFDAVAAIFVPAGYVVFAPMRRGHGDSEGPYIMDQLRRANGGRASLLVRLMEGEHLDHQLAGQAYVRSLSYVDPKRLLVAAARSAGSKPSWRQSAARVIGPRWRSRPERSAGTAIPCFGIASSRRCARPTFRSS
jgi:hypothetical protein